MANRTVVYTAILGNKDNLHEPLYVQKDVDYVCFTDMPEAHRSHIFDVRPLPFELPCLEKYKVSRARFFARRLKLFPHLWFPGHDSSIWIDGTIQIQKDMTPLLNYALSQHNFTTFGHHERHCLFEEIAYCTAHGRDNAQMLMAQADAYRKEGMPERYGFAETIIMFRRHHAPEVVNVMEEWWKQITDYSLADQVSLPYVMWKQGAKLNLLDMDQWHEAYFMKYPHNWFPKEDDRNRLRYRLEAWIYCTLRRLGLFTPLQKLYRMVKL